MKNLGIALSTSVVLIGCSASPSSAPDTTPRTPRPSIVVTYSVLGAVVSELVGDTADVSIVIPDGQDPHDFEPSAKDVEMINDADLLVANGLGFEEGLVDALDAANERGVDRFLVSDFVTTIDGEGHDHHSSDDDSHGDDAHDEDTSDAHATDPHIWLSPFALSEMIDDLGTAINSSTGLDVTDAAEELAASLLSLDARVADLITTLGSCTLVTGHDELGYFADRYGCEVVGAVIPSFSTTAEASAGELSDLKDLIEQHDVKTLFTGLGTSSDVVERLVSELDIRAVELTTHFMSGAQSYDAFMLRLVDQIVDGLS
ncbi:MAG: metal ABC transporter substrate-binding protein [Actinomycetota bacterium]